MTRPTSSQQTRPVSSVENDATSRWNADVVDGEQEPLLPARSHTNNAQDGGLEAWLTVLAGFCIFVNSWGLSSSFGVFLEHYRTALLPDTNTSTLAWIGSVQSAFLTIGGLVTGPLTDRGYLRPVMLVGHLMVVLGMSALSVSTRYLHVLLAQGFCVGIGAGMINVPAFAVISSRFTTLRPVALGCASTGASVGGIVFPLVFRGLAPRAGFGRTVRVMASINFAVAVPALMILCRETGTSRPRAKVLFDPRGLFEPAFGIYVVALLFQSLAFYIPLFYLTTYATAKLHTSKEFAFDLLAISNAASFFGRTMPYLLGARITPIRILVIWEVVGIALLFSWIAVTTQPGVIVWTVAWGFLSGGLVTAPAASTAHPTLSPSLDTIGARLGMTWSTAAFGVLIGAPIAGALADVPRADLYAQVFAGTMMGIAAILMSFPLVAAIRFDKNRESSLAR